MPLVDQMCRECGALDGVCYVMKICDKCKEGTDMKITKEMLGEAIDCSYASDSGINCQDLNHAGVMLEILSRVYESWDALVAFDDAGKKATQGEWTVKICLRACRAFAP